MEPSTFVISDGLSDLVMLVKKNIYNEAVGDWCKAVLALPYDLSDLEETTLRTYIDRCKETSQ